MKLFVVSCVFLLFTSLVIMTSVVSGKLTFESYPPSELMVTNLSDKSIPVYLDNAEANKIVMYLQSGLSLPYAYSGKSGDWHYVFIDEGIVVTLRSKNIGFSYKISETTNISTDSVNTMYWSSVIGTVLAFITLAIMLIFKFVLGQDEEPVDIDDEYSLDLNIHKLEENKEDFFQIKAQKEKKLEERKAKDQQAKQKEAQAKKAEKETQLLEQRKAEQLKAEQLKAEQLKAEKESAEKQKAENARKKRELITAKKASDAAKQTAKKEVSEKVPVTENTKRETARLRHELIVMVDEESKPRYRGEATIVQMRFSYDRLLEKYKSIKSEAESLGIDFDDLKYKKLLKARGYQIFLVSSLIDNKKYTVLEWIPDKGYGSDFSVESTTSPNLLVQDNAGNVIALVCRYRESYYLANNEKDICWASDKQAEQYKKFSKSRNVPILIAIGLRGKYNAPKYNFLVPLQDMCDKSNREVAQEGGFQLVLNSKSILDKLIKNAEYDSFLDKTMKELPLK